MKKYSVLVFGVLVLLVMQLYAADDGIWTDNFEKARKAAQKEGKDMFLDFTGSDWCGWCTRLTDEVFSKPFFKEKAPQMFILVKLDYPRRKKLPENIDKQNKELSTKYGIKGFPTILLTDAKGRPYAKTGYKRGGPENYIAHLKDLMGFKKEIEKLFKEAEEKEGIEKAKALDKVLEYIGRNGIQSGYDDVIDTIIELDKENKAGLKLKYEIPRKIQKIAEDFEASKDADKALEEIDKLAVEIKDMPERLQEVLFFKANIQLYIKKDIKAAVEIFKTAKEAAPESRLSRRIANIIKQLEARMEKKP